MHLAINKGQMKLCQPSKILPNQSFISYWSPGAERLKKKKRTKLANDIVPLPSQERREHWSGLEFTTLCYMMLSGR